MLVGLVAAAFLSFTPTAGAHDPDCTASVHQGPAKIHYDCDERVRDESNCKASVKVLFLHHRVLCQ